MAQTEMLQKLTVAIDTERSEQHPPSCAFQFKEALEVLIGIWLKHKTTHAEIL